MRERLTDLRAILLALGFGALTALVARDDLAVPLGLGATAAVYLTAVLASHRPKRPNLPSAVAADVAETRRVLADVPADAGPRLRELYAEAAARVDEAVAGLDRTARAVAHADRALAGLHPGARVAGELDEARARLVEGMETTAHRMREIAAGLALLAVRSAAGPPRPDGFADVREAIDGLRLELDVIDELDRVENLTADPPGES